MKKSEIRKLVQEYNHIQAKLGKSYSQRLAEKLMALEHRYYHETGSPINQK